MEGGDRVQSRQLRSSPGPESGPLALPLRLGIGKTVRMNEGTKHIVVGVDGSAAGAAALQWVAPLAKRSDAEIVAVSAVQRVGSELADHGYERSIEEQKERLATTWTDPARNAGASVRTVFREGDPRDVVLAVAKSEEADLVVLGRTGRGGGPGFLHLGSLVEFAAHHVERPLAVIPPMTSGSLDRIIVGVDGSAESQHAVSWCAELASMCEASVIAVAVAEPYLEWTPVSSADNWRRDVERRIDEWVAPITAAGVTVEHLVQRDLHPADGLLTAASARNGDLLVIGTRGAGGFLGLRAGGVAMKVLHRASLPIVLVPPDA